jgi:iron complex transport system substrate-binding protein
VVALSPTYLGFLDRLGVIDKLVGFSNPAIVHNAAIRQAAAAGRLAAIGQGGALRVEKVLALEPELIFTYATGGFRDLHPKLLEAGLKVAVCGEYVEPHPLGRAEWIKFIALFFGREKRAARVFAAIEQSYLRLAARARTCGRRPSVITNIPRQGHWGVSGGNSFISRFISDAGGDYVWKDIKQSGAVPMAIETVFDRGRTAEFWLNTGTWHNLAEARRADPRFLAFKALQTGRLYNNDRRVNAAGGNDFWESGIIRPDLILADLIYIFHPELLPGHQLVYYRKLMREHYPQPKRGPSARK